MLVVGLARRHPAVRLVQGEGGGHHQQHARERDLGLHGLRHGAVGAEQHRLLLAAALARALLALLVRVEGQRVLVLLAQPRLRGRGREHAVHGVIGLDELALARALAAVAVHLLRAVVGRLALEALAAARRQRRGHRNVVAVGVGSGAELALSAALALVAPDLVAAHLVLLGALAVAAALLLGRGRRLGRGHLAVLRILRHQEAAAHALAAVAVRGARALVVGLVAVAAVAAAHLLGGRRRGRPHRLAVLVLAERLERAALLAVVVLEHQALRLGGERLAALHPALAVRSVRVAVAAARLLRRLRRLEGAVLLEHAELDERARGAVVALVLLRDRVALLGGGHARARAAARHHRRGRRLSRGHLAVARVVGHQEAAAHVLTLVPARGARALRVGLVAIAAVAAAHLLGRGRRGLRVGLVAIAAVAA